MEKEEIIKICKEAILCLDHTTGFGEVNQRDKKAIKGLQSIINYLEKGDKCPKCDAPYGPKFVCAVCGECEGCCHCGNNHFVQGYLYLERIRS